MSTTLPVLISFSPEQFLFFVVAIVSATAGIILWVYKQTHPLDTGFKLMKKDIENIKNNLDAQNLKVHEMEVLLARLTERLSRRIRANLGEGEDES